MGGKGSQWYDGQGKCDMVLRDMSFKSCGVLADMDSRGNAYADYPQNRQQRRFRQGDVS